MTMTEMMEKEWKAVRGTSRMKKISFLGIKVAARSDGGRLRIPVPRRQQQRCRNISICKILNFFLGTLLNNFAFCSSDVESDRQHFLRIYFCILFPMENTNLEIVFDNKECRSLSPPSRPYTSTYLINCCFYFLCIQYREKSFQ